MIADFEPDPESRQEHEFPVSSSTSPWLLLGPLLYATGIAFYFLMRTGGRWAESDSAAFSTLIRNSISSGRITPAEGAVYPNGYAFQEISAFLVATTNVDVATLQRLIYPLTMPLVILPAWLLYRELTGTARGAALASLLLFVQPEFLFVVLRSSHEKFTRTLLLLCLYCLVRGFKLRDNLWHLSVHIGLFYLLAYAMIASNNLLANSFIAAVFVALGFGWLIERRSTMLQRLGGPITQRLLYVLVISLCLVYLFTFYVYRPAQHDFLVLHSIWERVAALFLDMSQQNTNAYGQVAIGWISLPIYFVVSFANWTILGTSIVLWLWQAQRYLWRGVLPESPTAWLLWLLYAAFAVQGAVSVVADASGAIGNLQLRIFPSFSIVAVAVIATVVADWESHRLDRLAGLVLAISIACFSVLSVLKATNEPLVSNKWTFYQSQEVIALDWSDANMRNQDIWTEFDERLVTAYGTIYGIPANNNRFVGSLARPSERVLLMTPVTRLRSQRLGHPLPPEYGTLLIYDNGDAELYRVRPSTPYQR